MYNLYIYIRRAIRITLTLCFVFAVYYSLALVRIRFIKSRDKVTVLPDMHTHTAHSKKCDNSPDHIFGGEKFINIKATSVNSAGNILMDDVEANTIFMNGNITASKVISNTATMTGKAHLFKSSIKNLNAGGSMIELVDCDIDTLKVIPITGCPKNVIKLIGNTSCKKIISVSNIPCEILHESSTQIIEPITGKRITKKII